MKKIILPIFLLVLIGLFFLFHLDQLLAFDSLKANRDLLVSYSQRHKAMTPLIFIVIYVLQTALSLPGAAILSMAAGAIFGVVPGTIYANFAATSGATIAFFVSRYLLHHVVERRFGRRLAPINRELEQRGFGYLLFLRLVPLFPFFLINLAAGLTSIRLRVFFAATLLGIVPGSFVFCNAGASLATIRSPDEILSPKVVISFVLLGMFALIPPLYGKRKAQTRQGRPPKV